MGFQGLLRTFADAMGLIETVEKDEDIFKDERKILFDRGEGLEKDLQPVIGKEISQHWDNEIVGGEDRVKVQKSDAWRGIHDDQIIVLLYGTEKPLQSKLP